MGGWIKQPLEQDHDALVLPVDDDGSYPWACSCGAGDVEDSSQDAHAQIEEHLAYYRLAQMPCAGLPRGQHWYELVVELAHELAGDQDGGFPNSTDDEIRGYYTQARAMLAGMEPGMAQMCSMCRKWESECKRTVVTGSQLPGCDGHPLRGDR